MAERILLIEDDPRLAEMVSEYLGEAGFRVSIAAEGRAGLERLAREPFDALVLDLMLPDMDGLEVFRAQLAATPPTASSGWKSAPTIICRSLSSRASCSRDCVRSCVAARAGAPLLNRGASGAWRSIATRARCAWTARRARSPATSSRCSWRLPRTPAGYCRANP